MRKQTKLVAVLSAAALLAIGASMTSFAAKGWVEENGTWYYYNADGDYAYDEWKKSGNNWFYLGEDGAMLTDTLVEDNNSKTYYVNANGAMVTNSWVAVEPGDDADSDAPDHYWYYFGANGQAIKQTGDKLKKRAINGKTYAFDEDGKMLYGFVDGEGEMLNDQDDPFTSAVYYFGTEDDGAMHTDWLQYTDGSSIDKYSDYDEMWFYFKPSTGKKVAQGANDDALATTTVRGNKYAFDENGVMQYDWQNTEASTSTPNKYFSDQTDGHMKKNTWVWAVPDEDMDNDDYEAGTDRWFFVGTNGKAYTGLRSVKGKKYLFNDEGIMKSGLQVVKDNKAAGTADLKDENGDITAESIIDAKYANKIDGDVYYFGSDEEKDGSVKTGKNIKITLDDGETYTFGFNKTGKAYQGSQDKGTKFYMAGLLITASSDYKNQAFKVDSNGTKGVLDPYDADEFKNLTEAYGNATILGDDYEVVSSSGTIVKNGKSVKDADGNYYAVSKSGSVAFVSADFEFASNAASCYAKNGKFGDYKTAEQTSWKCD